MNAEMRFTVHALCFPHAIMCVLTQIRLGVLAVTTTQARRAYA